MKQIQGSATTGSVWKYWAGVKAFNHWLHESWKSYGEIDKIANIGLLKRISLWRTTGKVKIKALLENQKYFHDKPQISLVELHDLLIVSANMGSLKITSLCQLTSSQASELR